MSNVRDESSPLPRYEAVAPLTVEAKRKFDQRTAGAVKAKK